ncbi:MAG: hypothetical protein QOJ89_1938 [bacterium]|jgi:hypothetical protein
MPGRALRAAATAAAVAAVVAIAPMTGLHPFDNDRSARPRSPATSTRPTPAARHEPRSIQLVRWRGPVEHLFFHTLVIDPQQAFRHDALGRGLRDYFVTVGEFRSIIRRLYANRWTLVDIHRAARGAVRVPRGRRPFVLSEDDVNYYDYGRGRGLGWRLVLDASGDVAVDQRAGAVRQVTGNDLVPIVDDFVADHPDFSAQGAKGVLALTGYQGLFGERIQQRGRGRAAALQRASALAARLRATGWTFASHTYGHIALTHAGAAAVARDTERWARLARPVIGRTDVLVYPFGARPAAGSRTARILRRAGFRIQCDIDAVARLVRRDGVRIMSRRHVDGLALAGHGSNLRRFFDVAAVRDAAARR